MRIICCVECSIPVCCNLSARVSDAVYIGYQSFIQFIHVTRIDRYRSSSIIRNTSRDSGRCIWLRRLSTFGSSLLWKSTNTQNTPRPTATFSVITWMIHSLLMSSQPSQRPSTGESTGHNSWSSIQIPLTANHRWEFQWNSSFVKRCFIVKANIGRICISFPLQMFPFDLILPSLTIIIFILWSQ